MMIFTNTKYKSSKYVRYNHTDVINDYISIRKSNPQFTFSDHEVNMINEAFNNSHPIFNTKASIINPSPYPDTQFSVKPSDDFMIYLWNLIFPDFSVRCIEEIKPISQTIITTLDKKYPSGVNMNEKELIRYITAHSSSSFIGIQRESKSKFALQSMIKSLTAHSQYNVKSKPWLIPNLMDSKNYISSKRIMDKYYGDVCLMAKSSRTSILGEKRNFRDYVFTNTFEDLISRVSSDQFPPYIISAGKRNDRRGKFRLICSFHADVRIIDVLLNNGSYDLCSHDSYYSQYTTEGMSGVSLWKELVKMSFRDKNTSMVCLDFKGYDSQISLSEYSDICRFLNHYRIGNDDEISFLFEWFCNWLKQPKFLISEASDDSKDILIPYYRTLASGLHGTHSFENLMGISYAKEVQNQGIPVKLFKANGDDQNIMTESGRVHDLIDFTSQYFEVEYQKSLIGHDLTVWGKKWFTRAVYPVIEIGTVRSIWESEDATSSFVDVSKLESNYSKILSLIIFLFRLGITKEVILDITNYLCNEVGIKCDQLPLTLFNLKQTNVGNIVNSTFPTGLESSKTYLSSKTIDMNLVGAKNVYDLLRGMYDNKSYFDLNVDNLNYHPKGSIFTIERNFDYSVNVDSNIPWMLRDLKIYNFTQEQNFIRSVLQGTNSYDGPATKEYHFSDMYSLALAIHYRNLEIWSKMQTESIPF